MQRRRTAGLIATALIFLTSPASALEKKTQSSAVKLVIGLSKLAKTRGGEHSHCLKFATKARLPEGQLFSECVVSDSRKKFARIAAKNHGVLEQQGSALAEFDLGAALVASKGGDDGSAALMFDAILKDTLGADTNAAVPDASGASEVYTCQKTVIKQISKSASGRIKDLSKCMKDAFRRGAATASDIGSECDEVVRSDSGSWKDRMDLALLKKCGARNVLMETAFPGQCSHAEAPGACLEERISCRVCTLLNHTLALGLPCDTLDDGDADNSCGELADVSSYPDSDSDNIHDHIDNCLRVANPDQRDTDLDGAGNACDGDFNNDGLVDSVDLSILEEELSCSESEPGIGCDGDSVEYLRSPVFDLNTDGRVDEEDLAFVEENLGQPVGERMDSDEDGTPDLVDRCPLTLGASPPILSGCNKLDFVRSIELVTAPEVASLAASREMLESLAPDAAALVDEALSAVALGNSMVRRLDVCSAATTHLEAAENLLLGDEQLSAAGESLTDSSAEAASAAGDAFVGPFQAVPLRHLRQLIQEAVSGVSEVANTFQQICDTSSGVSISRAQVSSVDNDRSAILLDDGRKILFHAAEIEGSIFPETVAERIEGIFIEDESVAALEINGLSADSPPPNAVTCTKLRFAPIQPFLPGSRVTSPVLHQPKAYLGSGGIIRLEQGMRVAVEQGCPTTLDKTGFIDVRITYRDSSLVLHSNVPVALDLQDGDTPVALPRDMSSGVATLHVSHRMRDCSGTSSCTVTETQSEDLQIEVFPRNSFCSVEYNQTTFAVDDQVPGSFGNAWVTTVSSPNGSIPSAFRAEGYELCPNSGGWQSCSPARSTIFANHSFAIESEDFFPVYNFLGALGQLSTMIMQQTHGVDRAAGLRWPFIEYLNNGATARYSCSLPEIVRDAVTLCPEETRDSFFRLPFADTEGTWSQGQGSRSGCHLPECTASSYNSPTACPFSHNCSWAYDIVAPCGTLLRASRAGRVFDVVESNSQRVSPGCTADVCPNLPCCPDTTCGSNHVVIQHQDGTFGRYVHIPFNGSVVWEGARVRRGEVISTIGSTGPSSGPHLHFEDRFDPNPPNVPPFGTQAPFFEIELWPVGPVVTCQELPDSRPTPTLIRSTNKAWP